MRYRRLEAHRGDYAQFLDPSGNRDRFAASVKGHVTLATTDGDMHHAAAQIAHLLACCSLGSTHGDAIYAAMRASGNPYAP
jgi:hypothetical protein